MVRVTAAATIAGVLLVSTPVLGGEPQRSYTFYFENDVDFLSRKGDDRFYTNGVRLAVQWEECYLPGQDDGGASGDESSQELSRWGSRFRIPLVHRLNDLAPPTTRLVCEPKRLGEEDDQFPDAPYRFSFGAHLGHNMYTPEDIENPQPQPRDRPYGAWLYVGTTLNLVSENLAHSLEVDLGVVGPSAQGEAIQNFIHREVTESAEVQGWDHQIPDEPALLLLYTGRWRLAELSYTKGPAGEERAVKVLEVVPSWGGALGNVFTHGKVGVMGRLGWNLPNDFGPAGLLAAIAGRAADETKGKPQPWDAYVFAGAEGRGVVHNVFLDGSLFRDSPSVAREDFVADLELGFSVRVLSLRLTYRQVRRSPEFVIQAEKQTFGAVNLTWDRSWK